MQNGHLGKLQLKNYFFFTITSVKLYLGYNWFTGTIPSTLTSIRTLENFYLNDNALTGSIPEGIENLEKLEWLGLYNNLLTGTIPPTIGNFEHLCKFFCVLPNTFFVKRKFHLGLFRFFL